MSTSGDATVIINDRYEIHKRVGRGGMADVFLARDRLLDRQVAIKVLFPEFAVDPNFVERFRREAQAAANLSHPNIVNVYDWGKYEGTYFIAMEYVQGRTLAEILKTNKRLTPKQAAEIASEVAAALGFAHEAGLAHRDIKPANILIGTNGQVKVADFGIARAMNSATESNLTQVGSVMGTASYFSPEQAQGAQPDPRSDLYSLGIVMYEMVAGKPPFTGENPVAIAYKQVHDQPTPLNKIVEGIPRPFEAIVAKLLAKDPKLRYSSAHALRDDLRRFRNGEQVQALVAAAARPGTPVGRDPAPAGDAGRHHARWSSQPTRARPGAVAPADRRRPDHDDAAPARARPHALSAGRVARRPLLPGPPLAHRLVRAGGVHRPDRARRRRAARLPEPHQGRRRGRHDRAHPRQLLQPAARRRSPPRSQSLGLTYRAIPEANAAVPRGFRAPHRPEAGTVVAEGTVIELYYNPTKALVAVPNVAGRSIEEARSILGESGFQFVEETELSDVPEGLVIRTDPAGEARVPQETVDHGLRVGRPEPGVDPADRHQRRRSTSPARCSSRPSTGSWSRSSNRSTRSSRPAS